MVSTFATFANLFMSRSVVACSVCFGQSDSPMAKGMNMGIFVMLGVIGAVLAAFAAFFIYLMHRARTFEGTARASAGPGRYAADAGRPGPYVAGTHEGLA